MSKKFIWIFLIFQIFFMVVYLRADVVITEIMAKSSDTYNNEFVEIFNNGEDTIDLTGWKIKDNNKEQELATWYEIKNSTISENVITNLILLPPKAYAVILSPGYLGTFYNIPQNTIILIPNEGTRIGNGLGDSGDDVILLNSDGEIVSSRTYTTATLNKSFERKDYLSSDSEWIIHTTSNTIGAKNSICINDFDEVVPNIEYVNDGQDEDISTQTSTATYSANWKFKNTFKYHYALSSETITDANLLTQTSMQESTTIENLELNYDTTYYFYIQGESITGDKTDIEQTNGVFIVLPDSVTEPEPEIPQLKLLINEVMPYAVNDEDWVEFYVCEGSGTLKNYQLKVGASIVKTFPDIYVEAGDYLVLNFGYDYNDELVKNVNGYFNLYTNLISGLVATDSSIILIKDDGSFMDCCFYADNDGTWADANKTNFNLMVSTGMWIASQISETECFVWEQSRVSSIAREYSQDIKPIDTNTKEDWDMTSPTKGSAREVILDDFKDEYDLKLLNTHFSPYGDYKYQTLNIKYKNKENTNLRIKIYNIQKHLIRTLLDIDDAGLDIVEWDGKDSNDNIMPVGIYVIYYEFIGKKTGSSKKGKRACVLGRRLS